MVKLDSKKLESVLYFLIGVFIIIIANQLSARVFYRFDLTEEKRYTISEASKNILGNLEDAVYVDVYLEGDMPAGVKRLQKSIRETLDEFKVYAGNNLQYRFINPSSAKSQKARRTFYESLIKKGIRATNLYDNVDGKRTQTLIFPGAVITYGTKEKGITFLKGNKSSSPLEQLNQSIEGVEYELSSAIKSLTEEKTKRIALLKGHGELDTLQIAGLTSELLNKYQVFHIDLTRKQNLLGYDAVVLAKPQEAFSEFDKYKIDQFIMRGGKVMFLIDAMYANMDSAGREDNLALPIELNLDDMFFKYGFRINKDMILDRNAAPYPVVVGNVGDRPQIQLLPWPFFPIVNEYFKHPAVRNIDAILTRFTSTIDTIKADGITKIPLMNSSQYSKVLSSPVKVSINELKKEMNPEFFNSGRQITAWIYEGAFTSLFKNRFLPGNADEARFISDGNPTKILIVSDGDIARNDINPKTGQPVELGFNQFTETRYANADFLLNVMTYLLEEDGIIHTRSKEIKIRPLDAVKLEAQKLNWQLINLISPIVLLVFFGTLKFVWRKRKYASFKPNNGKQP
ncbi:MAG: gliding motility-associated ABC transporter substrate-binding protein GldG [Cytophagales bacterium]|nr:gliding motility-associated ABC transporter substrate-binding protein GldG [Cytophagales bacterium]